MRRLIYPIGLLIFIYLITVILNFYGLKITYQVTPSMPKGFYIIYPIENIKVNDIIVFYPPKKASQFLLTRHLIPHNDWLMKYVVAAPGDYVCKKFSFVWINNEKYAPVLTHSSKNELLPDTPFCSVLTKDKYLSISTIAQHSFDGRYFGPIDKKDIIGKACHLF